MQAHDIQFKYTKNAVEVRRIDLEGGDVLVIFGELDMACFEWVLIKGGEVANHSDDGYGWELSALRDGLAFYTRGE